MAVAELELKSMDKYERQAYQRRRQEDILLYFMNIDNRDKKIAEQERVIADKEKALANKDKALAEERKAKEKLQAAFAKIQATVT
ncbi:MAG: hypothetical protein FWG65_08410 [Turicibacter sp.]|nr:hypothetical protein [Turicibacter sp.]